MRKQNKYEIIYKGADNMEHSWTCWATTKQNAKYQFEMEFMNDEGEQTEVVKRINKM